MSSAKKSNPLSISVIIPFKDKAAMTLDCVRSLHEFGPKIKEIFLVSNNSSDVELQKVRDGIASFDSASVVEYNHPFNYQKINNWAVKQTTGEYILFLNNDTELTSKSTGLIERLQEKASEKNVGCVGCLLLFAGEKRIQHAGVFLMPGGLAEHMYITERLSSVLASGGKTEKYPYDITKDMPMTAVTGAVTMIARKKFNAVNGFDERIIIGGGDVDLCIRTSKAGYQTWFVGGPRYIIHKESISRKFIPIPYNDFYWSYLSYITAYDDKAGDRFLPKIAKQHGH